MSPVYFIAFILEGGGGYDRSQKYRYDTHLFFSALEGKNVALRMTYFFPHPLSLLSPTEIIFLFVLFSDCTSVLVAGFFLSRSTISDFLRYFLVCFFWGGFVRETGRIRGVYVFLFNFVHPFTR